MKTTKQKLKIEADKICKHIVIENNPICEVCGNEPTETAHHFFPRSQSLFLRWDLENLVAIGRKCHFEHHHKSNPVIHATIIEKRGKKWYEELKEKAKNPPNKNITITYLKEIIDKLNE